VAVLVGLPALRIRPVPRGDDAGPAAVEGYILKREFFSRFCPSRALSRPVLYGSIDPSNDSEVFGITVPADAKFYWLPARARSGGRPGPLLRRNRSGRVLTRRDNGRLVQAFSEPRGHTARGVRGVGLHRGLAGGLIAYQNEGFEPGGFTAEKSLTLRHGRDRRGRIDPRCHPRRGLWSAYRFLPVLRDIEVISPHQWAWSADPPAVHARGLIEGVPRATTSCGGWRRATSSVPSQAGLAGHRHVRTGRSCTAPDLDDTASWSPSEGWLTCRRLEQITGGRRSPRSPSCSDSTWSTADRIAFMIMGPEIGDTFGIDDGDVIVIATLVTIAALFVVLPISYLADRFNRAPRRARGDVVDELSVLTGPRAGPVLAAHRRARRARSGA
jgi:hypothetical protein